MIISFRKSFSRDIKKIKDQEVLDRVQKIIEEVDEADNLSEIRQLKKMTGTSDSYRIRLGDYRIGIVVAENAVEFVRCLHRRDLYRFFP